jgi:hypothetical protein
MSEVQSQETAAPSTKAKRPAPEVFKIQMTDGRTVEFTGVKKRMDKEVIVREDSVAVRFDFRNGETRQFEVPANLLLQAAGHGVSQKVGDETAGDEKVEDMVIHVDEMLDRLARGEWLKPRGEGDSFSGASIVIKAVSMASGKTVDEVKKFLAAKLEAAEKAGQKLTRADLYKGFRKPGTKTAEIIKKLEEEQLSAETKTNGDELLAELQA